MGEKQRIIDLQKQVRIARTALSKIRLGSDAESVAEEAIDDMMALDPPTKRAPLASVLGWERHS